MSGRLVRSAMGLVAVCTASSWVFVVGAGDAVAATQQYTTPGTYEVEAPLGTSCATFVVDGAHGGAANKLGDPFSAGGPGSQVAVSVTVAGPTTFTLTVGGAGGDAPNTAGGAAGSNGGGAGGTGRYQDGTALSGGGGGGSSAVEQEGDPVAVSGGGGGGGSNVPGFGVGGRLDHPDADSYLGSG